MHRATVLLRVSTVVAFCAALIGGGAVGAKAEITASVPAGVHWRASPEGMPLWGPNRFWPGSGLVLRCLGPGFTVLALGPGFRPMIIFITVGRPHYTWMDGARQDLNALGPRLQLDLLRDWPKLALDREL